MPTPPGSPCGFAWTGRSSSALARLPCTGLARRKHEDDEGETRATNGGVTFRSDRRIAVGLDEPSDVTALPGGALFVVSDVESAGVVLTPRGKAVRVAIPGAADGDSGFEAVAYDANRQRLFVVREERHELAILHWAGTAASRPTLVATRQLPVIGRSHKKHRKSRNKGVEGMACLPAALSPTGQAQLLLAQEARPRALVLLDADGGGEPLAIALDRAVHEACADFSGLAVDPLSGHVFVCSDESATLAEIALHGGDEVRGELLAVTDLRDPGDKRLDRVEGIAIDAVGNLFVLLEDDRVLWRFLRLRRTR